MSMTAVAPPNAHINTNVNGNALSLFFPNDQPTPITFTHFLNLPPLLEPISPALAALHLARIRLVLSIPPGVIKQTAWCPMCGGLREAVPPQASNTSSKSRSGRKGSSPKNKRATKGKIGGKTKIKWAKQCGRCGMDYQRPKPDPESRAFPSARAVRAVRNKRKAGMDTGPELESATTSEREQGSSSMRSISQIPFSTSDTVPPQALQTSTMPLPYTPSYVAPAPPPPPPKYVHSHNMIHVHTSSPHPPTYTQPPPPKNLSPPPKEKSKKRKKSGLARLLAENKEREMGSGRGAAGAGGGWGLD